MRNKFIKEWCVNMFNIAIDGPAGAGKSTIAKLVAKKLGFVYVDTGSMYRAMALYCIRNGVAKDDEPAVSKACDEMEIIIEYKEGIQLVILNGEVVNDYIRTEEVSAMTSAIAVYEKVREKLLNIQRELALKYNVIMDGRDIGTNVLKNADVKIYLTASVDTRANRRYLEHKEKGVECDLEEIKKDIEDRDYRDMNRKISPLKQAEDAVLVDSSDMNIEQVVDAIIDIVDKKRK